MVSTEYTKQGGGTVKKEGGDDDDDNRGRGLRGPFSEDSFFIFFPWPQKKKKMFTPPFPYDLRGE